jgi:SM-20-related protein
MLLAGRRVTYHHYVTEDEIILSLGIYLQRRFLDASICEEIRDAMESHPSEMAYVKSVDRGDFVDERLRSARIMQVPISFATMIRDRLDELKSGLEAYFKVLLTDQEKPEFLLYTPGGCYAAHRDIPEQPTETREGIAGRLISVVIFLNDRSGLVSYSGGDLLFYGLSPDPQWKDYVIPLEPETGLLLAFRSETLHEVRPVTDGRRYTIATWIH